MTTALIQGVIPALVTPFHEDFSLNLEAYPAIISHLLEAGVGGFFICGSTGEVLTLSTDERKAIAEAVMAEVAGKVPVIVHVGATDTETAADLARHAKLIGAPAIGTLPPMTRGSLEEDIAFYKAVGAATDLPLYVYWRSDMARGSLSPRVFLEKMAEVPNFAGIKFTDPNFHFLQGLQQQSPRELNCLTGPDELFLAGQVMGAHGAIGTTYNIMPRHFVSIYQDFLRGNIKVAMEKQAQAGELIHLLIEYGVIAGTKAIMQRQGFDAGPARPNNTLTAHTETAHHAAVTDEQLEALMAVVQKYDLK